MANTRKKDIEISSSEMNIVEKIGKVMDKRLSSIKHIKKKWTRS